MNDKFRSKIIEQMVIDIHRVSNSGDIVNSRPMPTIPGDVVEPEHPSLGRLPQNTDKEITPFRVRIRKQLSQKSGFTRHDLRDCVSILVHNQIRPCASGILIDSNAVLTVNHFRRSSLYRSNLWQVSNSINVNNKDRLLCKPVSPPLKVANEDLEILILEKAFDFVTPIKLASTREIEKAKTGLLVGYGNDSNGVSGVKRELEVDIELCSFNGNYIRYNCNSKQHLIIKAKPDISLETDGINPRDSGSPLYINAGGKVKLAGIATRSLNNGEAGLFIRVDTYKNEIDKILARFKA